MECLVEEGKNNNITFLYTLGEGACHKKALESMSRG